MNTNIQVFGPADDASYAQLVRCLEVSGEEAIRILHTLRPIGVAMAGRETFDPYKD